MKLVFAERARQDIDDIYTTIAAGSPAAASRVVQAIRSQCELAADFPFASAATDEPDVRRLPIVRFPYTIFFRVRPGGDVVEVARILHSARVTDLRQMPETK